MSAELDALIIRSLPELDDAATRMEALTTSISVEIDLEVQSWIVNNGWKGASTWQEDEGSIWLTPPEWMVPDGVDDEAYLYFELTQAESVTSNYWQLSNFTGVGQQRYGFKLLHGRRTTKPVFTRFWRAQNTKAMPMLGAELFLPVVLDREALASAVENSLISDALQPLRDTLDRLPQLASQLEPLKQQIVAASTEKTKPAATP